MGFSVNGSPGKFRSFSYNKCSCSDIIRYNIVKGFNSGDFFNDVLNE